MHKITCFVFGKYYILFNSLKIMFMLSLVFFCLFVFFVFFFYDTVIRSAVELQWLDHLWDHKIYSGHG